MSLPGPLLAALEVGINRYLALDADVLAKCAALDGRSLWLELSDSGLGAALVFIPSGVCVLPSVDQPDVSVRGRSSALMQMARAQFDRRGGFPPGVEVAGDAGLLETVRGMVREIGFDPEEILAQVMPGGAAHRVAGTLEQVFGWVGRSARSGGQQLVEYVRDESRDLVHRDEIESWMDAVDDLRDELDRAEARLRRLESNRAKS